MSTVFIFVYGTLRKGARNDIDTLVSSACFVDKGSLKGRLFDLGEWPGAILDEECSSLIKGEVYSINSDEFCVLDKLERVDLKNPSKGLYIRERANVKLDHLPISSLWTWVYVINPSKISSNVNIPNGDWIDWHSEEDMRIEEKADAF